MGKDWDPCSMEVESARRYLGSWAADSKIIECVAWFDLSGGLRLIVADFPLGRRVIVRVLARTTKITLSRWTEAARASGTTRVAGDEA